MFVASSSSNIFNYLHEGISPENVLKRYALLFDNVIFNRDGCPIGKGQLASTLGEYVSMLISEASTLAGRRQLAKDKGFSKIFIDCWDIVKDAKAFQDNLPTAIRSDVLNRIGTFCHQEIRRLNNVEQDSYSYDIDEVRVLYGDIYGDIGVNQLLLNENIEVIPSYCPLIGRALSDEYKVQGIECHDLFKEQVLVPNFDELSWGEIIDLRNDKYVKSFRDVIYEISEKGQSLNKGLVSKVQNDLWSLVADEKPNITKSFLTGVIGNLPSPTIVNPIGVFAACKDVYDATQSEKRYGHVYFVHNLKSKLIK